MEGGIWVLVLGVGRGRLVWLCNGLDDPGILGEGWGVWVVVWRGVSITFCGLCGVGAEAVGVRR